MVRADNVTGLTDAGRQALLNYGVTRVIDLRWVAERDEDPPSGTGLEVVHVPLFGDSNDTYAEDRRLFALMEDPAESRATMYLEQLRRHADRFSRAVGAVASAPEGCVVLHCAGGVDRTGLVAALLLRLAGVPEEAVAADYVLSGPNWAPLIPEWVATAERADEREFRRFLATLREETMLLLLNQIDDQFGGVVPYLRRAGLSTPDLVRARERLRP